MTGAERAQAVALLVGAEAMKAQAEALHALAVAQMAAANALLGAEPPSVSPEAQDAASRIFEQAPPRARHFGTMGKREADEAAKA